MLRYLIAFGTLVFIGLVNPLTTHILFPGIMGKRTVVYLLAFDALLVAFIWWLLKKKPNDSDLLLLIFSSVATLLLSNFLANFALRPERAPYISDLSSNAFDDNERQYLSDLLSNCPREYAYSYKKQYFFNAPKNWHCENFSSEQFENGFFVRSTVSGDTDSSPVRIWVFGASTLYSILAPDDKTSPSFVSLNLRGKGISNKVTNFGVSGLDLSQELSNFITLLQETSKKPDYVIFYDGGIDSVTKITYGGEQVNVKLANGVPVVFHGFYSAFYYASEWVSAHSALYEQFIWNRVKYGYYAKELGETTFTPSQAAESYLKAMHLAQSLLKGEGIKGYFILQPMAFSRKTPVGPEAEHAVTKLSAQGREVYKIIRDTNSSNPMFHDLSDVFDSKSGQYFWDDSHLGPKGNKVIGEAIGDILMADIKANSLKAKKQVAY